jgi:arginase
MAIVERRWGSLGVPSSAGAQTPGLEKGPAAIRAAGFIDRVRQGQGSLEDHGDVVGFRWRPDPGHLDGQNGSAVARVAAATADGVEEILGRGQIPLVIGGDCTITIGVVGGFVRSGVEPALLYVDGGPDLYTPGASSIGHLDAMGLAHMLGLPGHLPEVAGIGPKVPLLEPDHVVSYGAYLDDDDPEQVLLDELEIVDIGAADIHRDVRTAAARALDHVEAVALAFIVHCDADVLAFADTPLSDSPDSGGDPVGLTLDELATSLAIFATSPRFAGLVLTEVNPDHAPGPDDLRRFATAVGAALVGATTKPVDR